MIVISQDESDLRRQLFAKAREIVIYEKSPFLKGAYDCLDEHKLPRTGPKAVTALADKAIQMSAFILRISKGADIYLKKEKIKQLAVIKDLPSSVKDAQTNIYEGEIKHIEGLIKLLQQYEKSPSLLRLNPLSVTLHSCRESPPSATLFENL
ncbi:MAG: hypothetical protein KGJ02_03680 [Verrucomicrobiota bacterium]|nr:hypothetical protein [Verrucomicrobiota bacterium]